MIAILDYGAGNLQSVRNALDEIGCGYSVVRDAAGLRAAAGVILPGVGHFGQMMRELDRLGVREPLVERIRGGAPFLGICLGMQALFEGSEEAPEARGLGIYRGLVQRFSGNMRVPHMGWNDLQPRKDSRLLADLPERPFVYFAHSYYVPAHPLAAAFCTYGSSYSAAIEAENVFGVQFHPEKSGALGLKIVSNFVRLVC